MSATSNYTISGAGNVATLATDAAGICATIPAVATEYVLPQGATPMMFQQVHDALVAAGKYATIKFQFSDQLSWSQAISINASYISVNGNWSTIDFSPMGGGIPITISGSVNPPYGQAQTSLQLLTIIGTGKAGTMTAILLAGPNAGGNGPSRMSISKVFIKEFNTGLKFGPNSYCQRFEDVEIYHCGTGIYFPDGQPDSGERPSFKSCIVFQSDVAVRIDGNHGTFMHFEACSFDYCGRQFDVRNGAKVWVTDCHIESDDYALAPIILTGDGTVFKMQGGQVVVTNAVSRAMPYIVDNSTTGGGGAYFNDVNLWKAYTANRYFSTGTGRTFVNGYTTLSTHDQPILLNANYNALKDGGFEGAIEDDLISIYKDSAAITSAVTGTNLTLSYSATSPRTGSKCLKATKVGAAGTNAGFFIAVSIRNLKQRSTYKGYFKTTATGSFAINPVYCRLQVDGNGVHINKGTSASEPPQTKSDTSGAWVIALSATQGIATPPEWATHYALFIDMTSKGAGDVYFDDIEIAQM